jgi:hypothetical protein
MVFEASLSGIFAACERIFLVRRALGIFNWGHKAEPKHARRRHLKAENFRAFQPMSRGTRGESLWMANGGPRERAQNTLHLPKF